MPYKITYQVQVAWVGAGAGPMESLGLTTGGQLPGGGSNGQSKGFVTSTPPVVLGGTTFNGTSGALASGDITTLTNAMAADISTQMNAAIGTMQAWVQGNP